MPDDDDGRSAASAGPIQYPALLASYAVRPPWNVAGVDYAVGCNKSPTKDPATPPPGTSYSPGLLTVNADNVVLSRYDFTLHGGVALYCPANDLTVKDCKFGGPNYNSLSTAPIDFRGQNLTFKYNEVDGGATSNRNGTAAALIFCYRPAGLGNITVKYCWLKNSPSQIIEIVSGANVDYRFNLIDDQPYISVGAHSNYHQLSDGTVVTLVAFNTTRQVSPGGAEGLQFYFNGTGTLVNAKCKNNTMFAPGATPGQTMSYIIHGSGAGTTLSGVPVLQDNYFDPSGAWGAFYPGTFADWAAGGNVNMNTGATIPAN